MNDEYSDPDAEGSAPPDDSSAQGSTTKADSSPPHHGPSDNDQNTGSDTPSFGAFNFHRIVRYGYGGFLLVAILLAVAPDTLEQPIKAGGGVVTPLAIFALGAAIYVLYRNVFYEFLLSPLVLHPLHGRLDKQSETTTNPANYLGELDVKGRWARHAAYIQIRRSRDILTTRERERFDFSHTEATMVYLTAVVCFIAPITLHLIPTSVDGKTETGISTTDVVLVLIATVFSIAAIVLDISLFKQEYQVLVSKDRGKVVRFLWDTGFLPHLNSEAK